MEQEERQILKICAIGSVLLLVASVAMWRDKVPTPGPEARAVVHSICPAGGAPYPYSADPTQRFAEEIGVSFSSELVKSQGFVKRAVFCAAIMWK